MQRAHVLHIAARRSIRRWPSAMQAWMSRAVLAGRPGTPCSSSREAARIASGDPKWVINARLRVGPIPGSPSSSEPVIALSRLTAMVGDGKAVRLVADALQQLQLGA